MSHTRRTPDQQAEDSDYEEWVAEESRRLRPIVLEERMAAIRTQVAAPDSRVHTLTQDEWTTNETNDQLETLIRAAAKTDVKDVELGRAFRALCDQCIGHAAQQGLDEAVDELARTPYVTSVRVQQVAERESA